MRHMYRPSCGADRGRGAALLLRNCGTNLWVVSQALGAPPRAGGPNPPPRPDPGARRRGSASWRAVSQLRSSAGPSSPFSLQFHLLAPVPARAARPSASGASSRWCRWPSASRRSSRRARWAPGPRPARSIEPRRRRPARPARFFSVEPEHANRHAPPGAADDAEGDAPASTEDETQHLPGKSARGSHASMFDECGTQAAEAIKFCKQCGAGSARVQEAIWRPVPRARRLGNFGGGRSSGRGPGRVRRVGRRRSASTRSKAASSPAPSASA